MNANDDTPEQTRADAQAELEQLRRDNLARQRQRTDQDGNPIERDER